MSAANKHAVLLIYLAIGPKTDLQIFYLMTIQDTNYSPLMMKKDQIILMQIMYLYVY